METFVIRLWVPAERAPASPGHHDTRLRGVVLHPASGDETPFTGDDELLRILRQHERVTSER